MRVAVAVLAVLPALYGATVHQIDPSLLQSVISKHTHIIVINPKGGHTSGVTVTHLNNGSPASSDPNALQNLLSSASVNPATTAVTPAVTPGSISPTTLANLLAPKAAGVVNSTVPATATALTPGSAIASNPATIPGVTPGITPGITPAIAPIATPGVVPAVTSVANPAVTPATTLAATPAVAPLANPATTPGAIPGVTPGVVPGTTPGITPTVTPGVTPGVTPLATPGVVPATTPVVNPAVTPATTPAVVPAVNPTVVPATTPVVTAPGTTPATIPVTTPTTNLAAVPATTSTVLPNSAAALVAQVAVHPTVVQAVPEWLANPLVSELEKIDTNLAVDKYTVDQVEKILKTPGTKAPWNWWDQCYNDRVQTCSPFFEKLQGELELSGPQLEILFHHPYDTSAAHHEVFVKHLIYMKLANIEQDIKEEEIPYHTFFALEFILGIGFQGTRDLTSSIRDKKLGLGKFVKSKGQLLSTLGPIATLGLHRLFSALLDIPDIKFTSDDSELRELIARSKEQPFVLTNLLKRVTGPDLRKKLSLDCQQCTPLASMIHRAYSVPVPSNLTPICLMDGSRPVVALHTSFLDSYGAQLDRREQVMLARSFLYLLFDVPLTATNCPACATVSNLTHPKPSIFVNAMLECYCTPRSNFHVQD